MDTQTTITIKVNIATGNKWEGNAEFNITLPEKHLGYINRNSFSKDLETLLAEAIKEYNDRNNQ